MISCTDAVRRLWGYLEDEVSAQDRAAVEEHLAFCRRCCGEVEFATELRTLLTKAADIDMPSSVEARLAGMLDDLVAHAGEAPHDDPTRERGDPS